MIPNLLSVNKGQHVGGVRPEQKLFKGAGAKKVANHCTTATEVG